LSIIASFAAIAIENARLHQRVIGERDRVIQAQEEVSRKLQRDLHDGPTQLVAALQMSIDFCQQGLQKDISVIGPELENMQQLTQRAVYQMRTLLFELRPLVLETEGLAAALMAFLERRQKSEKTMLHLSVESDKPDNAISRLKSKYEAALFAIIQEAVNNALKYAKANNIYVKVLQEEDRLQVIILDDGLGFDLPSVTNNYEKRGSYGMVNLKERVDLLTGQHLIKTALGAGTEVSIIIPLSSELLLEV
jgi:signal transduction histidine kinase